MTTKTNATQATTAIQAEAEHPLRSAFVTREPSAVFPDLVVETNVVDAIQNAGHSIKDGLEFVADAIRDLADAIRSGRREERS